MTCGKAFCRRSTVSLFLALTVLLPVEYGSRIRQPIIPTHNGAATSLTVGVADANVDWSAGWYIDPAGYAQTVNSGQDVYVTFTGTTAVTLRCDVSELARAHIPPAHCPQLTFSVRVGNGDWSIWSSERPVREAVPLASGLTATVPVSVRVFVFEFHGDDRWVVPSSAVRINGFDVDPGAVTRPTPGVPTGGDEYHYGDSIGEGTRTFGIHASAFDHDAREGPPAVWSAARGTRCNNLCIGGQGITAQGMFNVPPMTASWDKFDAHHSRLDGQGKFKRQPVAIHVWMGQNDARTAAADDAIRLAVPRLSRQLRDACASPRVPIVWHVPFSGAHRAAITAGVAAAADPSCAVLDGGPGDQAGFTPDLKLDPRGSMQSCDRVHPYARVVAALVGHQLMLYAEKRSG